VQDENIINGTLVITISLSDDEVDFIINYDIKYRMGVAPDDEE